MICEVDNDHRHIYTYFNNVITLQDCVDMFDTVAARIEPGAQYRQINIFDRNSKLHQMDIDAIKLAQSHMAESFNAKGLQRPRSAMVSLDELAEPVLNYWCALCDNNQAITADYRVFSDLEEACEWAGIPSEPTLDFIATSQAKR